MQHSSLIRAGIILRWWCTNPRLLVLMGNRITPAGDMVCLGALGALSFLFLHVELYLLGQLAVTGESGWLEAAGEIGD
jgi:hypothetical protein